MENIQLEKYYKPWTYKWDLSNTQWFTLILKQGRKALSNLQTQSLLQLTIYSFLPLLSWFTMNYQWINPNEWKSQETLYTDTWNFSIFSVNKWNVCGSIHESAPALIQLSKTKWFLHVVLLKLTYLSGAYFVKITGSDSCGRVWPQDRKPNFNGSSWYSIHK